MTQTAFQRARSAARRLLNRLSIPRAESEPVATVSRALADANGTLAIQPRVVTLTAGLTLTEDDSGTTYLLNAAGGFTVTLPTKKANLRFTFRVQTAPTTAYILAAAGSDDSIKGMVFASTGGDEDSDTTGDTIEFVANTALAGDKVELFCDGTSWFAEGFCNATGSITVT